MTDLDNKIREALNEAGIESPDFGNDDTLRSMISDAYAGKLRWMFVWATIWQLVFFGVWIWSGFRFFDVSGVEEKILWATVFLMSGMMMSMIKMLHWMTINRNRVLREVKRLELEVARLGKKLSA
jgi:fatty acid desaturase